MMQKAPQIIYNDVNDLSPHPLNERLFGNIASELWDGFVASIKDRGILNPLLITETGIIISGHQRWKAAKEIGIQLIPCIVLEDSQNENSPHILLIMIDCNVKQRGGMSGLTVTQQNNIRQTIADCIDEIRWWRCFRLETEEEQNDVTGLKYAKRLKAAEEDPPTLERMRHDLRLKETKAIATKVDENWLDKMEKEDSEEAEYDENGNIVKNFTYANRFGNDNFLTSMGDTDLKNEISKRMGISIRWLEKIREISQLCPTLIDRIDQNQISSKTAATLLTKLSPTEQEAFISLIPPDLTQKLTKKQTEAIVKQVKDQAQALEQKSTELRQKQDELAEAQKEIKNYEAELAATQHSFEKLNATSVPSRIAQLEQELELANRRAMALESSLSHTIEQSQSPYSIPVDSFVLSKLFTETQQNVEAALACPDHRLYSSLLSDTQSLMESLEVFIDCLQTAQRS